MRRTWARCIVATLAVALLLPLGACDATGEDATATTESTSGVATNTPKEQLLTIADVEKVSGLAGLKTVPYDPAIGAGGSVNVADESGQLVVMLVVEGPETWDAWLTDGFTVSEPVTPPVGDESFVGPNPDTSSVTYIFGFRKGDAAVALSTFFDANGETVLSVEQLRELAEIVDSRL